MNHGDRFDELLKALDGFKWDVVLLRETWRQEQKGTWEAKCGFLQRSAGGFAQKHGVGMLFNKRWKRKITQTKDVTETDDNHDNQVRAPQNRSDQCALPTLGIHGHDYKIVVPSDGKDKVTTNFDGLPGYLSKDCPVVSKVRALCCQMQNKGLTMYT